jgi:uncharacterized PurR-regulated membrane protein YhhQ (DUF165 family)
MSLIVALIIYTIAMTLANLLVAEFGPVVTPVVAFVLVGLDLVLRDWLQVRLKVWQMGGLIACTGVLTYALNPSADQIAMASSAAFTGAAIFDWAAFSILKGTWLIRSIGSNVVGAAVDSLLFPTIAFGVFMPHIVVAQFVSKVAGGAVWAWIFSKFAVQKPVKA